MSYHDNILRAIGRTPLVRLSRMVGPRDATVLVKPEYMNPGGSIKDRMALYILEKAEREGKLRPGGVIVENTSGNTGVGLAMAAALKGYRCVFTIPDKMSAEKVNTLKAFGAEVHICPRRSRGSSRRYYETANIGGRAWRVFPESIHNPSLHYTHGSRDSRSTEGIVIL